MAHLAEEHPYLEASVRSFAERCRNHLAGAAEPVAAARHEGLALLRRLAHHRQKGSDLVYEAYQVVVGDLD